MSHSAEKDAPYESCVIGPGGDCTRWSHDHASAESALAIVRLIEQDMAEQALKAWRAADARHGLSDHGALIIHADALTRWSERLRMALGGEDYRERSTAPEGGRP